VVEGIGPNTGWPGRVFGPILAVLRASDFNEAIALANDSAYA
jgi:acyl-CoA reductase-like NAD-dependent aldehyde dehydrogenase